MCIIKYNNTQNGQINKYNAIFLRKPHTKSNYGMIISNGTGIDRDGGRVAQMPQ